MDEWIAWGEAAEIIGIPILVEALRAGYVSARDAQTYQPIPPRDWQACTFFLSSAQPYAFWRRGGGWAEFRRADVEKLRPRRPASELLADYLSRGKGSQDGFVQWAKGRGSRLSRDRLRKLYAKEIKRGRGRPRQ